MQAAIGSCLCRLRWALSLSIIGIVAPGCGQSEVEAKADARAAASLGAEPPAPGSDRSANGAQVKRRVGGDSSIKASCVIQTRRSVRLKAEVGGRIETVLVSLGDRVNSGQLLAQMKTEDLQLELQRLRVALEQLQVKGDLLSGQISQAEANWQAAKELYADGGEKSNPFVSLQERRAELKLNRLNESDMKLQIARVEKTLVQAQVRSPMKGIVLSRNAEVGMVVAPGALSMNGSDILFEVADTDHLQAECAARESDARKLAVGSTIALKLDGLDGVEIGMKLTRIAPAVQNDSGSSSLLFWGEFDRPPNEIILPGMHGRAVVGGRD